MAKTYWDWCNAVYEWMMKHEAPGDWEYAFRYASEAAYGEALARWHKDFCNPNSYFSTEDPDMLSLKDELKKDFGLEVVSKEEGLKREKLMTTYRKETGNITEWVN